MNSLSPPSLEKRNEWRKSSYWQERGAPKKPDTSPSNPSAYCNLCEDYSAYFTITQNRVLIPQCSKVFVQGECKVFGQSIFTVPQNIITSPQQTQNSQAHIYSSRYTSGKHDGSWNRNHMVQYDIMQHVFDKERLSTRRPMGIFLIVSFGKI